MSTRLNKQVRGLLEQAMFDADVARREIHEALLSTNPEKQRTKLLTARQRYESAASITRQVHEIL
jgi:hypothetical protein